MKTREDKGNSKTKTSKTKTPRKLQLAFYLALVACLENITGYPDLDTLRTLSVLDSGKVMIPNGTRSISENQATEISRCSACLPEHAVYIICMFQWNREIWRDVIFVNAQQIFDMVRFPACGNRYSRAWESSWEFILFFMSPWHRRCCFVLYNSFFSRHFTRVYFLNTIVPWVSSTYPIIHT